MARKTLKEKIEKALSDAMDDFAEEIGTQIEIEYERAIEAFYDDYEPSWYERTYTTYSGSTGFESISKTVEKNDTGYLVGIDVGARFIKNDPYFDGAEWVFPRTFKKGIHGTEEIKVMKPTPLSLMKKGFKRINNNKHLSAEFDRIFSKHLNKIMK